MRIRFDATKKLIRGKRVTIEGGESRWVFFKYERLPNFCYQCGMLDYGEKDCLEKISTGVEGGGGCLQYGSWLRGEPGRRVGKDQGKTEDGSRSEFRSGKDEIAVEKFTQETSRHGDKTRVGVGHVVGQRSCQKVGLNHCSEEKREMRQVLEIDHGNGKVNLPQEKGVEVLDKKGMVSLTNNLPIAVLENVMQWEETKTEGEASQPTERKRNTVVDKGMGSKLKEMGPELKENISWADDNSSPLAMSFDHDKGWTAETLGPKSGHWKRIARQASKSSPAKRASPGKAKRGGLVPLIELNPNALNSKRKRGKSQVGENRDEENTKVGDGTVVVA